MLLTGQAPGTPVVMADPLTPGEQTILIAGRPLRLRLRRSPRARRTLVRVSPRRGVEVVLARRDSLATVRDLLAEASDWLAEQATAHGVWDGPRRRRWATGSELPLLGRMRRLELSALPSGRVRPRSELTDDRLRLELPAEQLLDPRPALIHWLRGFAGRDLRARTGALAAVTGLFPLRVMVGERTTRWGSCSLRGTVSFCYRLVLAPPEVVDAVVIHELCHLAHLDHGPAFYRLVHVFCPQHDTYMAWLREHGNDLEV